MDEAQIIYESKGTLKSLWNSYIIYPDHLKLQFRLFCRTIIIPKESIIGINLCKPPVIRTVFWALKLDLADFYVHVEVSKKEGIFKKLRFTPSNPAEFKEVVSKWAEIPNDKGTRFSQRRLD
ncbi:MAG: hypothetical protein HQL32_06055 [Planctomycetes bacterium]|nr:hypothetical protein [Planctomycetota bacterium]